MPSSHAKSALLLVAVVMLLGLAVAPVASAGTAYVPNFGDDNVSVVDTATNTAVKTIPVGNEPFGVAIAPDGKRAYVANARDKSVSVIDTATNAAVATITVGNEPITVVITPDGKSAYVVNAVDKSVSVIDTEANSPKTTIPVGKVPRAIAIAPDGKTAYVANFEDNSVSVIDTATNTVKTTVPVGKNPTAPAVTPDGRLAYVVNRQDGSVSAIDAATNVVVTTIMVGSQPTAIAVAPDGKTAYVVNRLGASVSVIDTATNTVKTTIPVGITPFAIAITPDGRSAYVTNANSVSVIDTASNAVDPAKDIPVGKEPIGIAIVPNQAPAAAFVTSRARPKVPVTFTASASKDPDGKIATYAWAFGDKGSASVGAPRVTHVFARPGTYSATLTLTDNEGCTTTSSLIFTGGTALGCKGSPTAAKTVKVKVAYPGVRLRCPRSARPRGCSFKLQAIAKKPRKGKRAKAQSQTARAKLKPGSSKIVSLIPKAAFAAKLATASRVLVKETAKIGASTRTRFLKLKIVQ